MEDLHDASFGEHPEDKNIITVHCKFGQDTHSVSISPQATILQLKEALQKLTGVLPRQQKLICKGKVLASGSLCLGPSVSDGCKMIMIQSSPVQLAGRTPMKNDSANRNAEACTHSILKRTPSSALSDREQQWRRTGVISLQQLHLGDVPPAVWKMGAAIRILDVSNNAISGLGSGISALENLEKLILDHNYLKDDQMDWQAIITLKHLKILVLNNNMLTCLPPESGFLCSLRVLSVAHNQLRRVPEEIGALSLLEKLDLSNNCLTELPSSLGKCSQLIEVSLSSNSLIYLPPSVGELKHLKSLNLNCNMLKSFPNEVLQGCEELATLNLHQNEITIECLREMDGWAQYDDRRKAKHSKQLEFNVLDAAERFDEGADGSASRHW